MNRYATMTAVALLIVLALAVGTASAQDGGRRDRRPRRTPTPVPAATNTPIAQPTNTPVPAPATVTPIVPTPPTGVLVPVDNPSMLGTCTAAAHDRFFVIGPDGQPYRTWHPQEVQQADGQMCRFAHEHGDNPAMSLADSSMPAFGYIGALAGMAEPHEGFKSFVVNVGDRNDEGGTALVSSRIIAHMGTARPGRVAQSMHSVEYDMVGTDGHYVHVAGMANTFRSGDICDRQAASQNNPVGRTLYAVPSTTNCNQQSVYEIWGFTLNLQEPQNYTGVTINIATAAFDPSTYLDRSTGAVVPSGSVGCDREAYHGPIYFYGGPAEFRTNVMGQRDQNGPLVQQVAGSQAIGIPFSSSGQTQFKLHRPTCAAGLGPLN
jgi:hypothetical protein